jgi:hypothetical protein
VAGLKCYYCRKDLPEAGTDYIIIADVNKKDPMLVPVCVACLKFYKLKPAELRKICPSPG